MLKVFFQRGDRKAIDAVLVVVDRINRILTLVHSVGECYRLEHIRNQTNCILLYFCNQLDL